MYPGRPTAGRGPARHACGPAVRHQEHRAFRRGRPSQGGARPGGDRVRRLAVPFLEAMPQAVPCGHRARHPAVPSCRCPARPGPPAGGQAGPVARTWSPNRDRAWDPCPAGGGPMKGLRADRRRCPAAGRYPVPRASQRPNPRADRSQDPDPRQHPEPGVRLEQDACGDRHCGARAGRSQDQGWYQKDRASPHQNPGARRRQSPGAARHRDPGVSRSHDADRHRHVRRRAGHRQGLGGRDVGPRSASYRCGAGQGRGQGRRARPAGTARRCRAPGHPRHDPGRCRCLASANASPERAPNRCRSCSLSSPRTPRWLPPRPVGSHSIMKHQPIPRPPFAPSALPACSAAIPESHRPYETTSAFPLTPPAVAPVGRRCPPLPPP
jgi:hypothetical protein